MNRQASTPCAPRAPFVLVALLAGCEVSPPERRDPVDLAVPASWSTAPDALFAANGAPGDLATAAWWTGFRDPQLDALVRDVLAGNRDLQAAAARLDTAHALGTLAGAPLWPEVDAGLTGDRARRLFLGFPFGGGGVPSSTTTVFGLNLSLRWELDLWGRLRSGAAASQADQQAALADFAGAQLSLVAQTCKAYFAAVEARRQLALAEATATALHATTDDVRDRFRRGVRPALDVHLAATNLANANATVCDRRDRLQRALRQLELLAGRYPRGLAESAAELPGQAPPVPAALPGELLQRRPDLVAAERRLAAAGCRVDAARAALYPRLSLTASGGTSSTELADLVDRDFRIWDVGANLLAPLFRGGALRADVARNEALAAEAIASYGSSVLRAFAEVEEALAADALLAVRRSELAAAAEHARQARDLARERWQLGLADFLAVADGQRQSYQAEAARIAAERACLDNRIDLFLAIGGGFDAGQPGASSP